MIDIASRVPRNVHKNRLALNKLTGRINEPKKHRTYSTQSMLNANYIEELKNHPEQVRWGYHIKSLHRMKVLTGRMKLHRIEEDAMFKFDLNLSADPKNERASKTLAMMREIVGLVTDAKLHLSEIYQKIDKLKHINFFLEPLKSSFHVAVYKLMDRFVSNTSNSVLSPLVTNYIEQCLGGTDGLEVSQFLVRIGPNMLGRVNVEAY